MNRGVPVKPIKDAFGSASRMLRASFPAWVRWASSEIYDLLFHGIEHAELAIGSGDIVLLRVEVGAHLAGQSVSALAEAGRSLVVALDRMGTPTIPGPGATFQEGDVAHIIVAREAIDGLRLKLEGQD